MLDAGRTEAPSDVDEDVDALYADAIRFALNWEIAGLAWSGAGMLGSPNCRKKYSKNELRKKIVRNLIVSLAGFLSHRGGSFFANSSSFSVIF